MKKDNKKIVIYQAKSGALELRADIARDTIWATQMQIANIFNTERSVITKHIKNILKSEEVNEKSNVQKMHIAKSDKPVAFYSLDVILSLGYRVNSSKAIAFRQWATKTLRQYITEGYVINKNRKHPCQARCFLLGFLRRRRAAWIPVFTGMTEGGAL